MSSEPGPKGSEGSPGPPKRIGFSVREVSQQLGLSEPFVRLEIKRGNLRASRVGQRVIVLEHCMLQWLDQGSWIRGTFSD